MQRHDLALAGFGERGRGATDEGGIAVVLDQRGAALALPAAGLQRAGRSRARRRLPRASARRRNGPRHARPAGGAGGAIPSASWAPAHRAAIRRRRALASRQARNWDCSTRGRKSSCRSTSSRAFMAAPSSATSRRISACAPASSRRPHQSRRGVKRPVAVERRRAQRAIGMGADQSGQGNPVGAHHRNDGHQADQPARAVWRGIAPRAQRGHAGAAACKGVHRQFPARQIIAVRLDRAFGQSRRHWLNGTAVSGRRPAASSSDARPTAALSAISTTSPFPRSRGGGASVAPRASRVAGEMLAQRSQNSVGAGGQIDR